METTAENIRKGDTIKLSWWIKPVQVIDIHRVYVFSSLDENASVYYLLRDINSINYAFQPTMPVIVQDRIPKIFEPK